MKVNVTISAELRAGWMRQLNPALKKKGLTIQEAVDRGLKERIPTMYLNMAAYLAALRGAGFDL